jgi:translocation and assembly module TamA
LSRTRYVYAAVLAAVLAHAPAAPVRAAAPDGIPYTVEITGVMDELRDLVMAVSRLVSGRDEPPAGLAGLQQRAQNDAEDFERVLRAEGYYGSRITFQVDGATRPAKVTVTIMPGPQFHIAECNVVEPPDTPAGMPKSCTDIALFSGVPARAATVIDGQARMLRPFLERGFPDTQVTYRALVDHATQGMTLTYTVMPGAPVRLGDVVVSGTMRTDPAFLEQLRPWTPGEAYDVRELDTYRERLNGLDLFDSVILTPQPAEDGAPRPVELAVHERPPRSFGGGLRYATDEGYGLTLTWEHRNLFGAAQRLGAQLNFATLVQSLTLTYGLPHRPNPDQRLDFTARGLHEITKAYTRSGGEVSGSFTTPLTRYWKARAGAAFQAFEVEDTPATRRMNLIASLPVDATYDDTDSLLDPKSGARFTVRGTPVGGTSDGTLLFLRAEGEAAGYLPLDQSRDTVLAGRLRLGAIIGESRQDVPPDWRFYSGGGGSVRGYGYQGIGPRSAKNDPLGGRSLVETSVELRRRLTRTFGAAVFVDAGTIGQSVTGFAAPRIGAGIGVRYYTGFGPIRADIATPVNPGPNDARFALYISIGQAF